MNSSGFKWVKSGRRGKSWRYAVRIEGVVHERDGFVTPESAYEEASKLAKELHGEFYNAGG